MNHPVKIILSTLLLVIGMHLHAVTSCDIPFVESQIEHVDSKLDSCYTTLDSKSDFILSAIDSCVGGGSGCPAIVLTSAGTLSTASATYCLAQNVTGDIIINASNITLDLNGYAVTGVITVSAPYATIMNGYITPAAPTSVPDTAIAAVTINANGCTITHCTIACADSTGTSGPSAFQGRSGIAGNGSPSHTSIIGCSIYAGAGTDITDFSAIDGGGGGSGIIGLGTYTNIIGCYILSGRGGNAGPGFGTSAPLSTGHTGGQSGIGIQFSNTNISNSIIKHCLIITNRGGTGGNGSFASPAGAGGNGGASGTAIICASLFNSPFTIEECSLITGTGGAGGNSIGPATANAGAGGNGGGSGIVIYLANTNQTLIKNCTIESGSGGIGGTSALTTSGTQANGGQGGTSGNCVSIAGQSISIADCLIRTGIGGTGGTGSNSTTATTAGNGGTGGIGGNAILIASLSGSAQTNTLYKCLITASGIGGTGGSGGTNSGGGTGGAGGTGGNGGHSIVFETTQSNTEVRLCTIENGGMSGSGGPGGSGTPSGSNGAAGSTLGQAIQYNATPLPFTDTIFQNVAHHIAGTPVYQICNRGLSLVSTGTSLYASPGRYDNVYQ